MSRSSFTLIELMISIALTTIIVFFLYRALTIQEQVNESLQKKSEHIDQSGKLFELIYRDFKEANKTQVINTFNKDYNIFALQTKNSLHNIPFAYVLYYINARDKTFVRLESASPIYLPVVPEKVAFVFADVLMKKIEKFRVFPANTLLKNRRELLPGEAPKKGAIKNKDISYLVYIKNTSQNKFFELK